MSRQRSSKSKWRASNVIDSRRRAAQLRRGLCVELLEDRRVLAAVLVVESGGGTDISEGAATDTYDIRLEAVPAGEVEVTAASGGQSEISLNGVDFFPALTLTFQTTTPQTVIVRAIDDTLLEGEHTSTLTHSITATADAVAYPLATVVPSVLANITDNDGVTITQSGGSTDVTEGAGTDLYAIGLDAVPAGPVQITVTADTETELSLNAIDFFPSVTLTFSGAVPKVVITRAIDDAEIEGDHASTLSHAITATADNALFPLSTSVTAVTTSVIDNDGVTITHSGGSTEVDEGAGTDLYTIALDVAPAGSVQITATADSEMELSVNAIDFFPAVTLTFDNTSPQVVTVRAIDDTDAEGPHTSRITHSVVATADAAAFPTSLAIDPVIANVTDNDATTVALVGNDLVVNDPVGHDDALMISVEIVTGVRRVVIRDPASFLSPASSEVISFGADGVSIRESDIPVSGSILVNSNGGNDRLTIDQSESAAGRGLPLARPLRFDGGSEVALDSLRVIGNGTTTVMVHRPDALTAGKGVVQVDGMQLAFANVERSEMARALRATLQTQRAADLLTLENVALSDATHAIQVTGSSGSTGVQQIAFFNNTTVDIDTRAVSDATDVITVTGADNSHFNQNLTFTVGNHSDTVILGGEIRVAGTVTINSTDAIVREAIPDTALDIAAETLVVKAASLGAIGGNAIETAVSQLVLNTSIANGHQFISEADDLTALSINSGTGNVTLAAGGSISDGDGDVDVTATSLTATATAFGANGPLVGTAVASLTINTSGFDGDQRIREAGGLSLLSLNAGRGRITLVAGGSITEADRDVDVTAAALTVTAAEFGAVGPLIGTAVESLTVNTAAASGDQRIRATDSVAALTLNAREGSITIVAGGSIRDDDNAADITAGELTATATALGAAGAPIHTAVGRLTVNTSAANGDQFVREVDRLNVNVMNAGMGNVTLVAASSITGRDAVNFVATSLTVTASRFGFPDGIRTAVSNLTVSTSGAGQFIREVDNLTALRLNAGIGNVTIIAGGSIMDRDGDVDIMAAGLTVASTAFGTVADPIDTSVATLTLNTAATNGDQFISETDGLTSTNLNAGTGNVRIRSGGSIADGDGDVDAIATSLTVTSTAFGATGPLIGTNVSHLVINTAGANGDQRIREMNDFTALNLNAGAGNVTIVAGGSITDSDADLDVTATSLVATASGFGAAGPLIQTAITELTLNTSSSNGDQSIRETDDLTALNLNAGTGDVSIVAGGSIIDADGGLDVAATGLTATATAFGATGPAISTAIRSLTLNTSGANGNQSVSELDHLVGLALNAGTGDVTVVAGETITDGDAAIDVLATALSMTASGVGLQGIFSIDTAVSELSVDTSARGSQFIRELDSLSALNLDAGLGNVTVVAGGSILDADADVDVIARGLTATATAFGAAGALIDTALRWVTVNTSGVGGSQFIREADDFIATNLNAGAGQVVIEAAGRVSDFDDDVDVTAASLHVTATGFGDRFGKRFDTSVDSLVVDTSGANGTQFVRESDGLAMLDLDAGTGNVTLVAGGAINDTDVGVDVAGTKLTAVAASFGAVGSPVKTAVQSLIVNTSSGDGDQFIQEADDLRGLALTAGAGNVTIATGSWVLDHDTVVDVSAANFTAAVRDGIGGATGLMTEVTSLDVSSDVDAVCNDVHIRNNTSTAGPLTIHRLTSEGGCDVVVANQGSASNGMIVAGSVVAAGAGAGVTLTSNSPLSVNAGGFISADGHVNLSATESDAPDDHVIVEGAASIQSSTGDITIRAGDDMTIESGASVIAGGTLTLQGDSGNDGGATIELLGTGLLSSAEGTFIRGMNRADTFQIQLERLAPGDTVTLDALDGADSIQLLWGADGVLNLAGLIVNAGPDFESDSLILNTSLDTAARTFLVRYDNNDGSGRFSQIQTRTGGSVGGTIDVNGIDQYNFLGSTMIGAATANALSLRGVPGQQNQFNVGSARMFEVSNVNCIHVLGQELADAVDLSAIPADPRLASLIDGGGGDDVLAGTLGRDVIFGDLGADTLLGGLGDDFLLADHGLDANGTTFSAVSDGDEVDGGAGSVSSAIAQGSDDVGNIVGEIFAPTATFDPITRQLATFLFSLAQAEASIGEAALAERCASLLISSGIHDR